MAGPRAKVPFRDAERVAAQRGGKPADLVTNEVITHGSRRYEVRNPLGRESLNRPTEWLDLHLFESVQHAQELATQWLWTYNNERPNTAIGGVHPVMC